MEDSFPQRLVAGKSRRRSALREPENSLRIEDRVPAKVRRLGDILGSSADLGEGVEEVPERRAVRDGVIDEVFGFSVNKFDARVIAEDVEVARGVGGEAAGKGREVGESGGERKLEERERREEMGSGG
ncbi:hypothetical protein LOK49_LG10G02069 [Camellia lanceoleosa]|uniref:Uncharacterized protein n=1 Tax=Camellia lanceoleosa TaxID=1840588 RepID=A0ACC0GAV6_9ERIC|nr:hypothetical protein LOK49_LG10G02069 [Camellia lanceoleosa]